MYVGASYLGRRNTKGEGLNCKAIPYDRPPPSAHFDTRCVSDDRNYFYFPYVFCFALSNVSLLSRLKSMTNEKKDVPRYKLECKRKRIWKASQIVVMNFSEFL